MNAAEKQTLERAIRQARPGDISVEAISSIGGLDAVRRAIKSVEGTAAQHQKTGGEVLLVTIRR